jgi:hypothetical protein
MERGNVDPAVEQLVRLSSPGAVVDWLKGGEEFWDARRTVRELKEGKYFPRGSKQEQRDEEDEDGKVGSGGLGSTPIVRLKGRRVSMWIMHWDDG